ncbi:MAG: prepilin-type N-terminal cleavage/methylation domain-containing protein [Alphaproteobacteria bacterium]|nr:prepilin-type N-terminal cleavage/methylation domain-containing protein [Alphaproteobacteria bacterium]
MRNERGSTMIEMMGVLGILGVLAASVYHLIDSALNHYRVSQGLIQVTSLQKNISRFYAAAGNYNDLSKTDTLKKLIKDNVIPQNMKAGDNAIRHVFGGDVELKNVNYTNELSSSSTSFSITFKNLDRRVCVDMATITWPDRDSANLLSIKIGTVKYTWPVYATTGDDSKVLPITEGMAMDTCLSEAGKNTNKLVSITWEFR